MNTPSKDKAKSDKVLRRDKDNREYLYRQLSEIIRKDIKAGKYTAGKRLPSMDDLSALYKVNKVTVRRALAELSAEGLIYSIPAQGTYVAEEPPEAGRQQRETLTVGLVSHVLVPGITGLYHMEIIGGIRDEVGKLNGNLVILPARHVEPQNKIYDLVMKADVDCIIYLGPFETTPLRRMIDNGPPSVLVDFQTRGASVDTILVDNRGGGYQAAEYLHALNHRRIALILGPEEQVATEERKQGALEALEQAGIPRTAVTLAPGDFQREGGYNAMADLLRSDITPTAVFCFNDEMAAGALQAIHTRSSLKVPQDISVIGFDDISWATATQPPLTTIQIDKQFMGRVAVQRLMSKLNDAHHTPTTTIVPTRIITRNSTAEAPAAS